MHNVCVPRVRVSSICRVPLKNVEDNNKIVSSVVFVAHNMTFFSEVPASATSLTQPGHTQRRRTTPQPAARMAAASCEWWQSQQRAVVKRITHQWQTIVKLFAPPRVFHSESLEQTTSKQPSPAMTS